MSVNTKEIIQAVAFSVFVIVLLYGQITIDWWQERKNK